jgi:hypothetical protein
MANEAQSPLVTRVVGLIPARAAGADGVEPIARAPFAGKVESVTYIPRATLTGADTDTRTISLLNKGAAGIGTTSVASLGFTNGVDATGYKEKALTKSGTAPNLLVSEGDVLAVNSAHSGSTGLADPGGLVIVEISRQPTAS